LNKAGDIMGIQIALIRGINVGPAKRVAMADFRTHLEEAGFTTVRTLLNSGNVVFDSPDTNTTTSAQRIEAVLLNQMGVSARTIVLSAAEIVDIIHENPLIDTVSDPSRLLVAVFSQASDRQRISPLTQKDWAPEALAVGLRACYLWCPDGVIASRLSTEINKVLGHQVTSRNWTTMQKLLALVEKDG
jgi:uncharacterized protein (DUF1697 family)